MKKWILVPVVAGMLVSFSGCKKNVEPKDVMGEVIQIALDNGDDCTKAAEKAGAFFDENASAWSDYVVAEVKAVIAKGEDPESVMDKLMSPPADLLEKYKSAKCAEDPAMASVKDKIDKVVLEKLAPVLAEYEKAKEDAIPKADPIAAADLVGVWTENASEGIDPTIFTLKADGSCLFQDAMNKTPRNCSYKVQSPDEAGGKLNKLIVNVDANEEFPSPMERAENIRLEDGVLSLVDGDSVWTYKHSELPPEPVKEATPYEKIPDKGIPVPLGADGKPLQYAEFIAPNEAATETRYVYKDVPKAVFGNYEKQLKKAGFKNGRKKGEAPKYNKKVGKTMELSVEINVSDGESYLNMWATELGK